MYKYIFFLLLPLIIVSCLANNNIINNNTFGQWEYDDVRLLDPVDTVYPEQDLISIYTRINNQFFQIRLDFLDLDNITGRDIYIPIDTNPGGADRINIRENGYQNLQIYWDYLIVYQPGGEIKVVSEDYHIVNNVELLITIDTVQENIVFSINQDILPITTLTKLQVVITPLNNGNVVDNTQIIFLDSIPPTRPKIQFIYWNTVETTSPAEALRSWAGAHSGPKSSRHGLKYLLDATSKYEYPIFLIDFCTPESISVIDYLSARNQIKQLQMNNQIKTCNAVMMDMNKKVIIGDFNYYNIFARIDYAQLTNSFTDNNLYLENSSIVQGNFQDLFLLFKSLIVSSGVSVSPDPMILGGDFRISYLGEPPILELLYSYIYNHPWIQVDNNYDPKLIDLINISAVKTYSINLSKSSVEQSIYKLLMNSPNNLISNLAWQVYKSLLDPRKSELGPLGYAYIGQIGHILAAANWVENPAFISNCNIDLDYDGDYECILSNENIFVTIEPKGGYISFIFSIDQNGAHQIVGPSWEFIVGLSDISNWDLSKGVNSDPNQILGAFVDDNELWKSFICFINDNYIEIYCENMAIRKSFILEGNKINISSQALDNQVAVIQIPLVLDPWIRFTKDWGEKYKKSLSPGTFTWEIDSGISVELNSNNNISVYTFNDTKEIINLPENPNYEYGRGYYIPFPMALAEIHAIGDYTVDIIIAP